MHLLFSLLSCILKKREVYRCHSPYQLQSLLTFHKNIVTNVTTYQVFIAKMQPQSFFLRTWLLQSQVSQSSQRRTHNYFPSGNGCYSHKCHNHHRNTFIIISHQKFVIIITSAVTSVTTSKIHNYSSQRKLTIFY
jgi:hypothetical protein